MKKCNICGWSGSEFLPRFKVSGRLCVCPECRSLDRNRHLYEVLQNSLSIKDTNTILDIAPSVPIMRKISASCAYVAIDFDPQLSCILPADIRCLPFPSTSFDVLLCSHVLEHVRDDELGIQEIHRVLRKDGLAFIQVPYSKDSNTQEFAAVDKHGHLRMYGREDFINRLRKVGFEVNHINLFNSELSGLYDDADVFICKKNDGDDGRQFADFIIKLSQSIFHTRSIDEKWTDVSRKPVAT